jgi:phosphotransferase family enzyme
VRDEKRAAERTGAYEWTALPHNEQNAAAGGIFRVRGGTAAGTASRILKVARPPTPPQADSRPSLAWPTSAAPDHFNYWRREVEAYQSGFAQLAFGDAGIRSPHLLSVETRQDGCVELWLEDVAGSGGFDLSAGRLGRFGYELGAAQARWVGRVPPRTELPWLSRRWLAQYLSHGPNAGVQIDDVDWEHPVARVWPAATRRSLRKLWQARSQVLSAAQAFPRTLCHLDLWPANLIEDAHGASVLIDWAFVGEGAIGEDPANLIIDSMTDGLMDIAQLPHLVDAVTSGYLEGLADGGWGGGADEARTAIATCAVAKYSWLGAQAVATAVRGRIGRAGYSQDDSAAETLERITPLAQLLAQWADAVLQ